MGGGTDYAMLYSELGLAPDCSVDELRRAYRRRVARLHPDLNGMDADVAALKRLNILYAAAVEFHRTHGRLPGTLPNLPPRIRHDDAARAPGRGPADPDPDPVPLAEAPTRWRYLPAVIIAMLAAAIWLQECGARSPLAPQPALRQTHHDPMPIAPASTVQGSKIRRGMGKDEVAAIMGEAHVFDRDRWVYGASWIRFHCGQVIEWYSSPLTPIAVEVAPAFSAAAAPARHDPRGCLRERHDRAR